MRLPAGVVELAQAVFTIFSDNEDVASSSKGREQSCSSGLEAALNVMAVAPMKFLSLPLGTVRPRGWLYDQVI